MGLKKRGLATGETLVKERGPANGETVAKKKGPVVWKAGLLMKQVAAGQAPAGQLAETGKTGL